MFPFSTHVEYLEHLALHLKQGAGDELFRSRLALYSYELVTLTALSFDPCRDRLGALYCPSGQGDPRDPVCMARSLLLMTMQQVRDFETWAERMHKESALAILAGFTPDDTPGASTYRDFLRRYADGPYDIRKQQDATLSQTLKGRHTRRLEDATNARRKEAGPNNTQSKRLIDQLLQDADQPRDLNALEPRLQDLLTDLGIRPTLNAGFIETFRIILNGDGTVLISAASSDGKKTCDCPNHSADCDHERDYTSATAQWCKDAHHPGWRFGDRSYTISIHVNRHDLPLITIVGKGNESDFTLAPKALDALLKLLEEQDLPFCPVVFTGDGHHDAQAIYLYLKTKGIVPIIPLRKNSSLDKEFKKHPIQGKQAADDAPEAAAEFKNTNTAESEKTTGESGPATTAAPEQKNETANATKTERTSRPQVEAYPEITFEPDGTPLCPGNCRMRHHAYDKKKAAHLYNCPAMRPNGKGDWIFHPEDCPFGVNCRPSPKMGLFMYLKSNADLRLFPPIPRDSNRFKELYNERTSVERSNAVEDSYHLDHAHRNAVFGQIRLCFVNICKHAKVRWLEATKTRTPKALFQETLDWLLQGDFEAPLPT